MSGRSRSANPATTSEIADGKMMTVRSSVFGNCVEKRLQIAARLLWAEIHLPVGGEDGFLHASPLSSSAATPGSSLPSRNSSDAPPPVETWLILLGEPKPLDRGSGVSAAHDRRGAVRGGARQRLRDRLRASIERRLLEDAHRPVPENGTSSRDLVGKRLADFGPMSNIACVAGIASRATALRRRTIVERRCDERILRQHELLSRAGEQRLSPSRRDRPPRAISPSRAPSP